MPNRVRWGSRAVLVCPYLEAVAAGQFDAVPPKPRNPACGIGTPGLPGDGLDGAPACVNLVFANPALPNRNWVDSVWVDPGWEEFGWEDFGWEDFGWADPGAVRRAG